MCVHECVCACPCVRVRVRVCTCMRRHRRPRTTCRCLSTFWVPASSLGCHLDSKLLSCWAISSAPDLRNLSGVVVLPSPNAATFSTVPRAVVTSNNKIILLLLYSCNFATVTNLMYISDMLSIWCVTPQRVCNPQVENCCFKRWGFQEDQSPGISVSFINWPIRHSKHETFPGFRHQSNRPSNHGPSLQTWEPNNSSSSLRG